MSNQNPIQSISDRVKDSSRQGNQNQNNNQPPNPSLIPLPSSPLPNSSASNSSSLPAPKSATQPQGKEKESNPKGKETTFTGTGEPDPASRSSPNSADSPTGEKSTSAKAMEMLLSKAVKAQEEGDDAKADRFLAMYDTLAKQAPQPQSAKANKIPATSDLQTNTKKRPNESEGTTQVRGIKFIWANNNSHDDGGFTPYFHKNLLELKGPIPLTIFNRTWQEEALSHHSRNRPKTEESSAEKNLRYHGLAVPDEWLQSFSDWTLNHQCFHETIRDRYNYPVLAEWILLHKANCDRLLKKHGFMVALRYDIRIRNNAFAFRVEKDGEESFSNISIFKADTADDAHAEARNFNELGVRENPYAIGGPKYGWDPHTGQKLAKTSSTNTPASSRSANTVTNQTTHHPSTNPLPPKPDQARPPRSSGYKGRNFNPNHNPGGRRRGNEEGKIPPRPSAQTAHAPEPQPMPLEETRSPRESSEQLSPTDGPRHLVLHKEGTPAWPEDIKCEMNVKEWQAALEKAGLTEEFADVIRGFKEGFDQGIPNHNLGPATPYFTPP
ncbi:hypothetical protein PGT21_006116 [Puccinia graminis f. sp. tritici]|uniref:Uncharacterized protein n=1 Tax=Puccinia graminis f. sp. tritici TaxID=56615 RepID=A0A5B0NXN8_PUCGR|nr:hypothetical protein PGTUg99_035365 [Puccinia graminis f. sp. tritici]KAA1094011.1 hypothetical protein PGT21_006116 [Puccinia graminis f. sp. tritici]